MNKEREIHLGAEVSTSMIIILEYENHILE